MRTLPVFLIAAAFWVGTGTGAGRAETAHQKTGRLQQGIDRASEYGNFSRVQSLRLELARHLAAAGEYAAAARQYELLLASRPGKWERVRYSIELGRMRNAALDYGNAINAFQDALHDDPKSWDASLELSRSYAQVELNTRAIESYRRSIKLRPEDRRGYDEIGRVYQRVGYLTQALSAYEKAQKILPTPETYLAMADCYVRQDDLVRATAILQTAKAQLPRADYDVRLGDIFQRRGNLAQACAAWEEALKADAKRDDVRLKLVMGYSRLNRRSDADHLLRDLTQAFPESPLVHFMKAWILLDRGDRPGARHEALAAQRLAPTELVRHYTERLLTQLQK